MKLAEALQERSDLNTKISQLKTRLTNNAVVQEGEQPAEKPAELLAELDKAVARLEYIIAKINLSNCTIKVDGKTLTEIIAKKDCLAEKVSALQSLITVASRPLNRISRTEIKMLSTINVPEIQKESDMISAQIRSLNTTLQQTNWTADLIED